MDIDKTHREKARWEVQKNATSYIKQTLKTTPYETIAVRPFNSHLKIHPSKTNKTILRLLEWRNKDELRSEVLLWTSVGGPRTYLHHLKADTGCTLKDLPRAMDNRDG